MLHQIELFKTIPVMTKEIEGFIDETRGRLADLQKTETRLSGKYHNRLKRAEEAWKALGHLLQCLNE